MGSETQMGVSLGIEASKDSRVGQFGMVMRGAYFSYVNIQPILFYGEKNHANVIGAELKIVLMFAAIKVGYEAYDNDDNDKAYIKVGVGFWGGGGGDF